MFHKVGSIFPPSFPSPTLRRNINRYVKRRARLFQCCQFLLKLKFLRLCCCYIMWNEVKCLQQSDYIYVPASWNGREKKIHAKVIVHSRSQGCNIDITLSLRLVNCCLFHFSARPAQVMTLSFHNPLNVESRSN